MKKWHCCPRCGASLIFNRPGATVETSIVTDTGRILDEEPDKFGRKSYEINFFMYDDDYNYQDCTCTNKSCGEIYPIINSEDSICHRYVMNINEDGTICWIQENPDYLDDFIEEGMYEIDESGRIVFEFK